MVDQANPAARQRPQFRSFPRTRSVLMPSMASTRVHGPSHTPGSCGKLRRDIANDSEPFERWVIKYSWRVLAFAILNVNYQIGITQECFVEHHIGGEFRTHLPEPRGWLLSAHLDLESAVAI